LLKQRSVVLKIALDQLYGGQLLQKLVSSTFH